MAGQGWCLMTQDFLPLRALARRRSFSFSLVTLTIGFVSAATAAEDTLTIPELVITASRVPVASEQVGSALSVLTGDDLESRQTRVISDALRQVPGLSVNRTGGAGSQTEVYLRGAKANQTLVLIDGIEVNNPGSGSAFDFGDLVATDIERIEVLRGPQSALWGSDAVGGVINVITRQGQGAPTVRGMVEGGSFGTSQVQAGLSGATDLAHYALSASRFATQGVSSARSGTEADGYKNTALVLRGGVSPTDTLDIELAGRLVSATLQYDDFGADPALGLMRAVDADIKEYREQAFGRLSAELRSFDDHWRNKLDLSVASFNATGDQDNAWNYTQDGLKTKIGYQSSVSFATDTLMPAQHVLTALVEHEAESAYYKSAWSKVAPEVETTGVVGEYRLTLFDALSLSGSVRQDFNELFDDATTTRATAAYVVPQTQTKVRASVGTGVKNPTLFQLYGYTSTFKGNPDLRPEKSFGWDVGADQPLFNKRLTLGATFFHTEIDKLIQGSGVSAENVSGVSTINGVELTAQAEPLEHLHVAASYTFQNAEDADGKDLVRRPNHLASLDVSYRFLDERAQVFSSLQYNGARQDTTYDLSYTPGRTTLDGYTLVSFGGSYALVKDKVELFGRVENALDQDYQEVFSYGAPGIAGYGGLRLKL